MNANNIFEFLFFVIKALMNIIISWFEENYNIKIDNCIFKIIDLSIKDVFFIFKKKNLFTWYRKQF